MYNNQIKISLKINGQENTVHAPPDISALALIRDILKLKGSKEGCGIGECGACTILVDGKSVNACIMLAAQLDGREVLTVEGLNNGEKLSIEQNAFLENHAVQCGFCSSGLLMSTHALLSENPNPDQNDIRKAISGNLCRCTGYHHIVKAVGEAAKQSAGDENNE
ncbi:MAG: (2Fe-2S)-binding protein [Desulfobacterales bacterium]|nr:(2Fe-2S)-binding protein [Desulfobacterales bacterium]